MRYNFRAFASTRKSAVLDYFLVSSQLSSEYTVEVCAQIANSDHNCISVIPKKTLDLKLSLEKPLFEMRRTNTERFLFELSRLNCTPFYRSSASLDDMKSVIISKILCLT